MLRNEVYETITPGFVVDITKFLPIVQHPVMRRLREIKQLGALSWIYPDATHTRYAHALMTLQFTEDTLLHRGFSKAERHLVKAYALTHDVGHTPYSHELEQIAQVDQMESALQFIEEQSFAKTIKACDIDPQELKSFFYKHGGNPLRAIVSDKVLGTDKLAYLTRDGLATGKGGYDNVNTLLRGTIFLDGKLGVDQDIAESALKQVILYHTTYAGTYFGTKARLSQRLFTLLGQLALERQILPENWQMLTDPKFDYHIERAIEHGHEDLRKLQEGIRQSGYIAIASLRLPGAETLEELNGQYIDTITEQEYKDFLIRVPTMKLKALEDRLAEDAGLNPLDIVIVPGGSLERLRVDDTLVFRGNGQSVYLLAHLYPTALSFLQSEVKRQAISVRFFIREERAERFAAWDSIKPIVEDFKRDIA